MKLKLPVNLVLRLTTVQVLLQAPSSTALLLGPKSLGCLRHALALHVQLQQARERQTRDSEQSSARRRCHSFGNVVRDDLRVEGKTTSATDRDKKAAL